MTRQLYDFLMGIRPLSKELQAHLLSIIKTQKLAKREIFLKPGQVCDKMCFVECGLLRAYIEKDGREVTAWFMGENDVLTSITSFYERYASIEFLQALEPTEIAYITFAELHSIYENYLEFNYHGRVLTTKYLIDWDKRIYSLLMTTADERFEWLQKNRPGLLDRVQQKYIASFVGITAETFSAVRSDYLHHLQSGKASRQLSK